MGGRLSVNEGWVMTSDTAENDAGLRDTDQADQLLCGHLSVNEDRTGIADTAAIGPKMSIT
eukprot:7882275-Karenia_brevis.AAC.1